MFCLFSNSLVFFFLNEYISDMSLRRVSSLAFTHIIPSSNVLYAFGCYMCTLSFKRSTTGSGSVCLDN